MTATAARRGELAVLVGEAFEEFRQAYGCRRIAQVLNVRGHACGLGLVAGLMRDLGLRAVQPLAYRVTAVHRLDDEYSADLIERDFTSDEPGTRLVGDITYLRTGQGWPCLATVIDLATRMVVGWQIADLPVNCIIHPAGLLMNTSMLGVLRRPVESAVHMRVHG